MAGNGGRNGRQQPVVGRTVWLATSGDLKKLFRMHRLFRLFLLLLAGAGLFKYVAATEATAPDFRGEISGRLALRMLTGAPPLNWRVQLQPAAFGPTEMFASFAASGMSVELIATMPTGDQPGRWRIVHGSVNLGEWARPALSAAEFEAPPALEIVGDLILGGEGSWRGTEFEGSMTGSLRDGSISDSTEGWEARKIDLDAVLTVHPDHVELKTVRLTAGILNAADVNASALLVEAVGGRNGNIEVRRVEIAALGGLIVLDPFNVDLENPKLQLTANLAGLAMAELAKLLPKALADGQGRIDGRIRANWSPVGGFQPREGSLTVSPGTPAAIRLAPAPGFLTQHLPERIALMPSWLRLPAQWLAPVNPAYEPLQRIELGQETLTVDLLRVALYPDGVSGPRSAVVEVMARPSEGGVVESVSFTINLAGPLQQVLQLGLDDRARVKFGIGK